MCWINFQRLPGGEYGRLVYACLHGPRVTLMPLADESLFNFPCAFPIKAMGWYADDFAALVIGIVRKYAPDLTDNGIEKRNSRGGRYISITVTIRAQSREQLDNIYRELTSNGRVLIAL